MREEPFFEPTIFKTRITFKRRKIFEKRTNFKKRIIFEKTIFKRKILKRKIIIKKEFLNEKILKNFYTLMQSISPIDAYFFPQINVILLNFLGNRRILSLMLIKIDVINVELN